MLITTSFNKPGYKKAIRKYKIICILLLFSFIWPFAFLSGELLIFVLLSCLLILAYNFTILLTLLNVVRKNLKDVNIKIKNNMISINESNVETTFSIDNIKNFKEYDIGNNFAFAKKLWMPHPGYINPIKIELFSDVSIRVFKRIIKRKELVISDNENHDLLIYISNQLKRRNYKRR